MENLQVDTDNLYMICAINIKRSEYILAIKKSLVEQILSKEFYGWRQRTTRGKYGRL